MSSDQHYRQEYHEPWVGWGSRLDHCLIVVREMSETVAETEQEEGHIGG